jgi:hypothetical protein
MADNLEDFISKMVDRFTDQMFVQAHHYAKTTSGDIFPEQAIKLDEIKADLKLLIEEQVTQNVL